MNTSKQNIDFDKIEEMVEGDGAFRVQLLDAIVVAVKELQVSYIDGIDKKDEEIIKQARHKIKPTIALFGLSALASNLGEGKRLIENGRFKQDFKSHKSAFLAVSNALLDEINENL